MPIDLQRFCATDADARTYLRKPWRHGKWVYATNGHMCVRVPVAAAGEHLEEPKAPDAAALFERALAQDGEFLILPPVDEPVMCFSCERRGFHWAIKCADCTDGSFVHGHHTYECLNCKEEPVEEGWLTVETEAESTARMPCFECYGRGYALGDSIQLGEAHYQSAYLAQFAALAQCRIRPGDPASRGGPDKDAPAALIFDGGQGLLMPRLV